MEADFSTKHFDFYRMTPVEPKKTFYVYLVYGAGADREIAHAVCSVCVKPSRRKNGYSQIILLNAWSQPDWTCGEIAFEALMGIRDFVGRLSFDQFERLQCDSVGVLDRLDQIVPPSLRDRLRLSMIDDTWNMLLANELAAA